jgi:hypothetical protein
MNSREDVVSAIAREIERHFETHSNAADSVEGIRGWWLSPTLRAEPLAAVVAALEELERRGIVVKTELEGAGAIYSKASVRNGK